MNMERQLGMVENTVTGGQEISVLALTLTLSHTTLTLSHISRLRCFSLGFMVFTSKIRIWKRLGLDHF